MMSFFPPLLWASLGLVIDAGTKGLNGHLHPLHSHITPAEAYVGKRADTCLIYYKGCSKSFEPDTLDDIKAGKNTFIFQHIHN